MDDGQTLRSMVRDDAYRVVRVLSDGPSGKTELVTLDGEGPLVRKRIPAALANAAAWVACLDIDEPLLPRIESLYPTPDELVVVYDYVPGTPLKAEVAEHGPMDAARAVSVLSDVCRALSALHERGVVHRDITPGNIILADDGAHLIDLGIARVRKEDGRHDTTALGTWGYAAPEQFGFAQTDARSDVYALGRLLGYLLTGEEPSGDEFDRALNDPDRVDVRLSSVIAQATAFEPSARYQSAAELAEALRVIEGESPQQSPARKPKLLPLAWAAWIVLAAISLFLLSVSIGDALHPIPTWGWAQNVMVAIIVGACAATGIEVYRALYQRPPYAGSPHPARMFLKRLLAVLGIELALFFLLVLVYATVSPVE